MLEPPPGDADAERAADYGFVALWCSSLRRARETTDIVGTHIGLVPREDERLIETDAGDWTDRLFSDVQAEDPDGFARFLGGDPAFAFPSDESFAAQGERVAAALADIEQGKLPSAALVPLDPEEAERTDIGGGEALPPS